MVEPSRNKLSGPVFEWLKRSEIVQMSDDSEFKPRLNTKTI